MRNEKWKILNNKNKRLLNMDDNIIRLNEFLLIIDKEHKSIEHRIIQLKNRIKRINEQSKINLNSYFKPINY